MLGCALEWRMPPFCELVLSGVHHIVDGACECQPPAFLLPLRLQFWKAKHELLICGCAALCCAVLCCAVLRCGMPFCGMLRRAAGYTASTEAVVCVLAGIRKRCCRQAILQAFGMASAHACWLYNV